MHRKDVLRIAACCGSGLVIARVLAGCAGPQPLDRAIRPADDAAYGLLTLDKTKSPRAAFLEARASELKITPQEAEKADLALSTKSNPFDSRRDAQAVSRGAVIYSHECASCHGKNADGAGPALPMPLASLNFHRTALRMDITMRGGAVKKWFKIIQEGSTAHEKDAKGNPVDIPMPAFANRLSREQTWLAITYLQSLDKDLPASPTVETPR
ncbi:MAG: c-type cytochrome [Planctomycetota bacterium]|nr:c-type cytochrome [Planctomycetota bacterium]